MSTKKRITQMERKIVFTAFRLTFSLNHIRFSAFWNQMPIEEKQYLVSILKDGRLSKIKDCIDYALTWSTTFEGHAKWSQVDTDFRKLIKILSTNPNSINGYYVKQWIDSRVTV